MKDIAKTAQDCREAFLQEVTSYKTVLWDEEKLTRKRGELKASVGKKSGGCGMFHELDSSTYTSISSTPGIEVLGEE